MSVLPSGTQLLHPKGMQSVLGTKSSLRILPLQGDHVLPFLSFLASSRALDHCRVVWQGTSLLTFPNTWATFSFLMLRDTEPRVHALVCFIHGGGTGVWLGFKTHLAPWALCPILRHAVGNVKPLLNIRSPPSASVFPLRWLPDSQGQGHTGGGEREGWRLPVYRKQDTKALLFRIFLCTLWGSSFVHSPHTLPHFFMCCFFPIHFIMWSRSPEKWGPTLESEEADEGDSFSPHPMEPGMVGSALNLTLGLEIGLSHYLNQMLIDPKTEVCA